MTKCIVRLVDCVHKQSMPRKPHSVPVTAIQQKEAQWACAREGEVQAEVCHVPNHRAPGEMLDAVLIARAESAHPPPLKAASGTPAVQYRANEGPPRGDWRVAYCSVSFAEVFP